MNSHSAIKSLIYLISTAALLHCSLAVPVGRSLLLTDIEEQQHKVPAQSPLTPLANHPNQQFAFLFSVGVIFDPLLPVAEMNLH